MKFFVYLLRSSKDQKYYIGQTDDVVKRFKEHNFGREKSTKSRTPFVLIGFETYKTRSESMWRERELKKSAHQRNKFIKKLLIDYPAPR